MRIVVVGSGFGGLAAAIRLQSQGHKVTLVEKLDKPGGRAYVFEQDGFTFDAGPTIITAPWILDQLFALTGRSTADFVKLVALDPFYNIRFEDGTVFHYSGNQDAMMEQIRALNPADQKGYLAFRKHADRVFQAGMPLIDRPFNSIGSMLRALPTIVRTRTYRSVTSIVNSYLKDERLRQVFSFHPLLIGGNPFSAPSMYALIHSLEQRWGVLFCMGGTGALVRALAQAFELLGGEIRYEHEVAAINVGSNDIATGVSFTHGGQVSADAVVFNGDVTRAWRSVVPPSHRRAIQSWRMEHLRQSMSLFVMYFGTNRQYPGMAHHEILMGPRYRGLLDDIFRHKTLASDFSLYLHRPSATDPTLAPAGHDAWYALAPVPNLGGHTNWEQAAETYRDHIVAYLEERYLPGLSEHIVSERRVDPRYFRDSLNSHLGNAFGPEPLLVQSAWFRPHNRDSHIHNLYFCGAGTHPGAGLPGVLSSGKIVADMIGSA